MGLFSFLYRWQSTQLSTVLRTLFTAEKMVLGPLSLDLPVQNPGANLPHHLPHNHGGSSGEDDSGFQIWLKNETV